MQKTTMELTGRDRVTRSGTSLPLDFVAFHSFPLHREGKSKANPKQTQCSHREAPQHGGYHSTFSPLCLELRAAAGPGCAAGAGTLSPLCPFTLLLVGSCAAVGSSSSKPLRLHPARVLETERGHTAGEGLPPVLGPALLRRFPAW